VNDNTDPILYYLHSALANEIQQPALFCAITCRLHNIPFEVQSPEFTCNAATIRRIKMVENNQTDKTGAAKQVNSEELLLMSAENLKKGIQYAVSQINSRTIKGEMKVRWIRSLTRQIEALIKVVEAVNNIGSKTPVDFDLATYLSSLEKKMSAASQAPISSHAAKECRRTIRRAIFHVSELRHAHRQR